MQVDTSHIENRLLHSTRLPARHPNLRRSSVNFRHWWCFGLRGEKPWIFHCRLLTRITVNSVSVCVRARVNGGFVWIVQFQFFLVFYLFIYLWFNFGGFFVLFFSLNFSVWLQSTKEFLQGSVWPANCPWTRQCIDNFLLLHQVLFMHLSKFGKTSQHIFLVFQSPERISHILF